MKSLKTLLLFLLVQGALAAQDIASLPPPEIEVVACPPQYYFNLDFALVQPRFKSASIQDGPSFTPNLDWAVSTHFEYGLLDRGPWNPYIGYRGLYSNATDYAYESLTDTLFGYGRSAEINAIDFGVLSEPFALLAVIRAQWDFSIRLTIADFQNTFGVDFTATSPSFIELGIRQQFVGAGPRAGMRFDLPLRDTGLSISSQIDAGVEWGSYKAKYEMRSRIDDMLDQDGESATKGGILWHAGAQLALRYAPLKYADRLSFSVGYLYETWFSKDLALLEGSTFGQFDYHGPFFRMEWKY